MSIEDQKPELNIPKQEQGEVFNPTLDGFLEALKQEGINTLPADMIRKQLEQTGVAIVTRDYNCGIRVSRSGSQSRGYKYRTWTTNDLENPDHPLSQKFARKDITID